MKVRVDCNWWHLDCQSDPLGPVRLLKMTNYSPRGWELVSFHRLRCLPVTVVVNARYLMTGQRERKTVRKY
jgi:hypothetical protein